jgi:hypothetical protein
MAWSYIHQNIYQYQRLAAKAQKYQVFVFCPDNWILQSRSLRAITPSRESGLHARSGRPLCNQS